MSVRLLAAGVMVGGARGAGLNFHIVTYFRKHALADQVIVDRAVEMLRLRAHVAIKQLEYDQADLDAGIDLTARVLERAAHGLRAEGIILRSEFVHCQELGDASLQRVE